MPPKTKVTKDRAPALPPTANGGEIGLQLPAGRGLVTDQRFGWLLLVRSQERVQLRQPTGVATRVQFPQQHHRRDPLRLGRRHPSQHVLLERIELRRARGSRSVPRRRRMGQCYIGANSLLLLVDDKDV